MYSLKYSVNLSRRACWSNLRFTKTIVFIIFPLTILTSSTTCHGASFVNDLESNKVGDGLNYPKPDLERLPDDFRKSYKGFDFVPM